MVAFAPRPTADRTTSSRSTTTTPRAASPIAALVKRIWQVDPLVCPRCTTRMKIVSFNQPTQRDLIQKTPKHYGLAEQPSRAPPPCHRTSHDLSW
jgi:hypothetical protein